MADKKISALTSYAPVVGSVIIPASYLVDGKYTTGKIEASAIKEFVLKETDTKVATSTELINFATAETIGKQIYLTTADENYGAGLYVVTGINTVQKLAVSSATGDFGQDIAEIIASYTAADSAIITAYTAADSAIITAYADADSALAERIKAIEEAPYATVSYVETAKGEAVTSANEYTDTQVEAVVTGYTTADGALAERIKAIEEAPYATVSYVEDVQGEIITLSYNYTDTQIATVNTTITENEEVIASSLNDLNSRISTNTEAIATLNGDATTPGSVAKQVTDEIAKVVANAPEQFDTLKEIADYIANDQTGAAELANRISAIENAPYATVSYVEAVQGEIITLSYNYTDTQVEAVVTGYTTADGALAERIKAIEEAPYATVSYVEDVQGEIITLSYNYTDTQVEAVVTGYTDADSAIINAYTAADSAIITAYTAADSAIITAYADADSALAERIKAIEDAPYVKQEDLTTLEDKVTTNTQTITKNEKVIASSLNDLNSRISTLEGVDTTVYALKSEVEAADTTINETIAQLQATIAALEAKLAKYDARFGYQEDSDDWTVNFLVID